MKKTLGYIGAAALLLFPLADSALAQTSGAELHAKTLATNLLSAVIFATVGIIAVFVAFKVFDKATPRVDIEKELLNHNVAVAILAAAVIIGISIIVAASIMG
jgi:putative membrane protein